MHVQNYIKEQLKKGTLHFALIDPERQDPKDAGRMARIAEEAGSSAIMVGGSTISSPSVVDDTIKEIKKQVDLPVIIFPSSSKCISRYADAIFFMSLLNSRNPDYLIEEQAKGSLLIKKFNIEPIPLGYIVVEPGMEVGKVGEANLIGRDDCDRAIRYALAAQYLGMSFVYLEAGSGANEAVPDEMIRSVKKHIDIPLIVGGGIKEGRTAIEKAKAGADIIVTGSILEKDKNSIFEIVNSIKGVRK